MIAIAVFAAFAVGAWVLLLLIPLLPIIITVAVIRFKLRRGQRTAEGRAVCDQVEGFKTYLATAEADQLKFEEGEDIFSKYLPWAIIFELADRWAKICADLVAMGRLPNVVSLLVRRELSPGGLQHLLPHQQPDQRCHAAARRRQPAARASAVAAPSVEAASQAAAVVAAVAAAGDSRPTSGLVASRGRSGGVPDGASTEPPNDAGQHERDLRAPQSQNAGHARTA